LEPQVDAKKNFKGIRGGVPSRPSPLKSKRAKTASHRRGRKGVGRPPPQSRKSVTTKRSSKSERLTLTWSAGEEDGRGEEDFGQISRGGEAASGQGGRSALKHHKMEKEVMKGNTASKIEY